MICSAGDLCTKKYNQFSPVKGNDMETRVIQIEQRNIEELYNNKDIALAAEIIKEGGLVAFPTETVYGLGANALNVEASKKIYSAKGRPSDNPLILHIGEIADVEKFAKDIPQIFFVLADKFWPGPMTVILKKKDIIPKATSGGLDTVAIRMPSNTVAKALIKRAGVPIAAPSANVSGRPSPTKAVHVLEDMKGKIDMIIDGGSVGIGVESTIVDLTENIPTLLRPGAITIEMLKEICTKVNVDPAIEHLLDASLTPKAPGMKYKHYAPKADMTIVKGEENKVLKYFSDYILKSDKSMAVITVGEHLESVKKIIKNNNVKALSVGSIKDMDSIAHNLFDILRKCDELKVDFILSEAFDETGIGKAIMNRLKKAAGYHIINV